uniref:Ig-like domain-containing protein n=1 Tax=Cynoglossus semilaevis TaxID=244447 RepID=A0A3P8WQV0_CYNSE
MLLYLIIPASGSSSGSLLQGEVGGNVTVHCPVDKKKTVELFYFQHGDTYINGFHSTKHSQMPKPWNYTKVNRSEMTVHMSRLNLSHTGRYNCIISYTDGSISEEEIQLNVSANYSEPTVTTNCDEENLRCFVTCASHGGYPENQNSSTMLYSSSSTAVFNCSAGEWTNLSCSVGNVASKMVSICEY